MYSSAPCHGRCLLGAKLECRRRYNREAMPYPKAPSALARWSLAALRVLLVSFLLTLLSFAVCLFLGIMGLVISAGVRGFHPNMTVAYREIAFPAAVLAGAAALVVAITLEVRHQRKGRNELHLM